MCAVAAAQNKLVLPDPNPRNVLSHMRYAYHIDATLYARYLRHYAEKRGVIRFEGKVDDVLLDKNSGDISSLVIDNDTVLEGTSFSTAQGLRRY